MGTLHRRALEYVPRDANAATIVNDDYRDTEDLGGLFSGFDPETFADGRLVVRTDSTAWATQLRLMQSQLLAKINAAVGQGVVTSLNITGPSAPSWRKGPLHVPGRGPRDTYG